MIETVLYDDRYLREKYKGRAVKATSLRNKPDDAVVSSKYVAFVVARIEKIFTHTIENRLVEQIKKERKSAEIEEGSGHVADRSAEDAIEMVVCSDLVGKPRVMQSSDGFLTLEWHGSNEGLALIFAGDGRAAISVRRNGGLYEDYGREVSVQRRLPLDVVDILARLSQ